MYGARDELLLIPGKPGDTPGIPGIEHAKAAHRQVPTIQLMHDDTIEQEQMMYLDGKPMDSATFKLQRVEQL